MAIGCVVVHYAGAAHAYSAGIKCRHCTSCSDLLKLFTSFIEESRAFCFEWSESEMYLPMDSGHSDPGHSQEYVVHSRI